MRERSDGTIRGAVQGGMVQMGTWARSAARSRSRKQGQSAALADAITHPLTLQPPGAPARLAMPRSRDVTGSKPVLLVKVMDAACG